MGFWFRCRFNLFNPVNPFNQNFTLYTLNFTL